MEESKSIDQWQELVKYCNESSQSKAAFCRPNVLNYHQFLYWCTKFNKKTNPLIPVTFSNANEPLAIIRLGNDSTLEVVSSEALNHILIDNNHTEREIKPFVIARKNFLFAGSQEGTRAL